MGAGHTTPWTLLLPASLSTAPCPPLAHWGTNNHPLLLSAFGTNLGMCVYFTGPLPQLVISLERLERAHLD